MIMSTIKLEINVGPDSLGDTYVCLHAHVWVCLCLCICTCTLVGLMLLSGSKECNSLLILSGDMYWKKQSGKERFPPSIYCSMITTCLDILLAWCFDCRTETKATQPLNKWIHISFSLTGNTIFSLIGS